MVLPDGGPWTIFIPQLLISFGNGIFLPNCVAGAVSVRPQAAGTASGITGFVQMSIGAAAAQAMSHVVATATTRDAACDRDADAIGGGDAGVSTCFCGSARARQ